MKSFSKTEQILHNRTIHRDPERLRKLLGIVIPTSPSESMAQRYGKCSHPKCGNVGTIDRPLDLHHIVPRSQAKYLINEYSNHLYLCGDFFKENHHKALHGEMTPGMLDWRAIGFFGDWSAEADCSPAPRVDGAGARLLEFSRTDRIALALIKRDIVLAFDYAIKKDVFPKRSTIYPEDVQYITDYIKNNPNLI